MQSQDADARSITTSIGSTGSSENPNSSRFRNLKSSTERRAAINQQLESATTAAKKWGLNVLSRQSESWKNRSSAAVASAATGQPYGRGQPLPQMGQPPPQSPELKTPSTTTSNSSKRWSVPAPPLPPRTTHDGGSDATPPPLPPRTREEVVATILEGNDVAIDVEPSTAQKDGVVCAPQAQSHSMTGKADNSAPFSHSAQHDEAKDLLIEEDNVTATDLE